MYFSPKGTNPNKDKTMANKVYNFSAGPSVLPEQALKEASAACIDFANSGISILSMSHRSKPIENMFAETEQMLRDLMGIPENYDIVFLGGGCSLLFSMVAYNFLTKGCTADYVDSGVWSSKAIKEAKGLAGELGATINVASSSKASVYNHIDKNLNLSDNATFLHVTATNTIYGTEWKEFPKPKSGFLAADMSSDFLARKVNVEDFGLIYGGAQKNISCAGVTVTIIRKDLVGLAEADHYIPTMLKYSTHIPGSMYNTPPVFAVYTMNRTLNWLKNLGGVEAIEKINKEKAALLYSAIDASKVFVGTAAKEDRSLMNVPFVFKKDVVSDEKNDEMSKDFLEFAKARGLQQLKGHRSVGGFRASIYNAMPIEGVQALVDCMGDYEKKILG